MDKDETATGLIRGPEFISERFDPTSPWWAVPTDWPEEPAAAVTAPAEPPPRRRWARKPRAPRPAQPVAINVLAFPVGGQARSLGTYEILKAGNVSVLRVTGAHGMVQLCLTREAWIDFTTQLVAATPRPVGGEP